MTWSCLLLQQVLSKLYYKCDIFAQNNGVRYYTVCMLIKQKLANDVFSPTMFSSENVLKCVTSHKYLGYHNSAERKDDQAIAHQCRNVYSHANMLIRNFKS
jgi:hypothetical protein